MKIATYNVNSINARLPVLLRWLAETSPDAVCLQELKTTDEKFPESELKAAGYNAVWHGQKSWNGVAILAKTQPQLIRKGLPNDPDEAQSRYIEAKIEDVVIGCLYLPNGNPAPGPKWDYKLRWLESFTTYAANLAKGDMPVLLAGDYNIIPTEKDAYKPERWVEDALFRPEVRTVFETLQAQGWADALRQVYPSETVYTYFDYFRNAFGRNAGLRIDHLLLNAPLAARLKGAGVDREVRGWEKSSDHCPVWIEVPSKPLS
jgi:exodeoxyribonuclease-3